jgi:hypothetical protein
VRAVYTVGRKYLLSQGVLYLHKHHAFQASFSSDTKKLATFELRFFKKRDGLSRMKSVTFR